jgi:hypothetical protein
LAGATDSIYQRIKAAPSESGRYFVVLKNQWGTTVSKYINVVVDPLAVITQQPLDTTILKLNPVTFSVNAVGAAAYQWRYNGNIIPGATSSTYTIPIVYMIHAGNYSCDVFSSSGCLTASKPARLNVMLGPPPIITAQTDSVTICELSPLDIVVAIKPPPDTQPVRVTWFKNNVLLRSDNPATFTTNSAGDREYQYYKAQSSISDIGTYHVLFEALDSSTAVSKSVPVQVNPNPVAMTTPTGKQIICEGDSVVLSSSTGAKYQWLRLDTTFQNQVILNAVNRKYTVKKSGIYAVLVDNEFGCQTQSAPDTVVVRTLPDPTFTPSTLIACVNDTITLTANDPSLTAYQWFLNGKAISGATLNTYKATVTGDYFLQVTNDAGCKNADSTRQITSLLFNVLPTVNWITQDSARICEGEMYTMQVGNFVSYQWYKTGTGAIVNANDSTYTTGDQGFYTVEVVDTNSCKSPMSVPFFLRVDTIPDIMTTVATSITNCNGAATIELCTGASLNLVGTVTNGGKKPLFQWLKNNLPIDSASGGQNDRITLTNLLAGDTYSLQVKSFFDCTTAFDMDTSNILGPVGIDPNGDCDGDGKLNALEQTASFNLPNELDLDGDGLANFLDDDDDGDGIPTCVECQATAGIPGTVNPPTSNTYDCFDTDGNGIPDYLQVDSDGDCVPDNIECSNSPFCEDSDGDGIPNFRDLDSNNDGIPDGLRGLFTDSTNLTCFNNRTGRVTAELSGGIQPYSIELFTNYDARRIKIDTITNDMVVKDPTTTDSVVITLIPGALPRVRIQWIGIPAGKYYLLSKDFNNDGNVGCAWLDSIVVNQPARLTPVIAVTNNACFGDSRGAILNQPTGGTPGYTYRWSTNAVTQNLQNLTAGNYTVTVTDSRGCRADTSVTVTQPTAITLSFLRTNINCKNDSTGSIDLTVNGGKTPYTYSWTGPNGFTRTTQDITGLKAGTYTVVVRDSNWLIANSTANC